MISRFVRKLTVNNFIKEEQQIRLLMALILFSLILIPKVQASEALKLELKEMGRIDQAIRAEITEIGWHQVPKHLVDKLQSIDRHHCHRLKEIVAGHGWPSISLVGQESVDAAFLLLQHCPDTEFRVEVLPMLKSSFLKGKGINGQQLALFTDRTLLAQGQKQLYGTQAKLVAGKLVFEPIAEKEKLNIRRVEMGLPSMQEYRKILMEVYKIDEAKFSDLER